MKKKQIEFFEYHDMRAARRRYGRTQHGGVSTKGRRKNERPLSTKKWIHLVLKSDKAKGVLSFRTVKNSQIIRETIKAKSQKFGVRVAEWVNVGDHLHLKIKISSRENFQKFLKSTTTLIARRVTGARRGKKFGRFWQGLAFTRVLTSAIEELHLRVYLDANLIQREFGYEARAGFLSKFQRWIRRERQASQFLNSEFCST